EGLSNRTSSRSLLVASVGVVVFSEAVDGQGQELNCRPINAFRQVSAQPETAQKPCSGRGSHADAVCVEQAPRQHNIEAGSCIKNGNPFVRDVFSSSLSRRVLKNHSGC
ncbi:unnamed protein product, partial [Hapterophycus canaliculatus]